MPRKPDFGGATEAVVAAPTLAYFGGGAPLILLEAGGGMLGPGAGAATASNAGAACGMLGVCGAGIDACGPLGVLGIATPSAKKGVLGTPIPVGSPDGVRGATPAFGPTGVLGMAPTNPAGVLGTTAP